MLPKKYRLNLRKTRDHISNTGKTVYGTFFTLLTTTDTTSPRFGVLLSRKLSLSAVKRNHLKRQVHEIIRTHLSTLPSNIQVMIIPKRSALTVTYSDLEADILKILNS